MQRAERRLDVDALRAIILSMGSGLSSSLDSSLSSILASTGNDGGDTSSSTSSFTHEVSIKMDILIGMVTNVIEQVSVCAKYDNCYNSLSLRCRSIYSGVFITCRDEMIECT